MKIQSYSLQGKRPSNEDQHVYFLNLGGEEKKINKINFVGVFDGHGGKTVSTFLKKNVPKTAKTLLGFLIVKKYFPKNSSTITNTFLLLREKKLLDSICKEIHLSRAKSLW